MSKKNEEVIDHLNETPATSIEAAGGEPSADSTTAQLIETTVEADTREDATAQLNDLRKKAEAEGLVQTDGGFITYNAARGKFTAVIKFNKP